MRRAERYREKEQDGRKEKERERKRQRKRERKRDREKEGRNRKKKERRTETQANGEESGSKYPKGQRWSLGKENWDEKKNSKSNLKTTFLKFRLF